MVTRSRGLFSDKQNDDNKYILVAIAIFSPFAHCQPNKKEIDVVKALQSILSGTRKPKMVRTDRGMEFRSKEVNKYLQGQNIFHFYTLNTETKVN